MKTVIIGGGAAGMMAAAVIAENSPNEEILIIEKNGVLGYKVMLSGGGRCNITTTISDTKELIKAYPRGGKWLRYGLHEFGPKECYKWFEDHGIPLKTEKARVFPASDKGSDVIEIFTKIFEKKKVKILYRTKVKEILKEKEGFTIHTSTEEISADKVIITTGGGTSNFATSLGHTVSPLVPSLTSFITEEKWVTDLAGVSIGKVKLKLTGKEKHEFTGPILFTHRGITGPAIFAISALSAYEKCPLSLSIDLVPEVSYEELLKEAKNPAKFIPKSLAAKILETLKITPPSHGKELSKKDQNRITESLKNLHLTLKDRTPGTEIVTAGGVSLKEINEKTMESKLVPGVYFAGEILDIDGFTGGFNLQAAWTTGWLAGQARS